MANSQDTESQDQIQRDYYKIMEVAKYYRLSNKNATESPFSPHINKEDMVTSTATGV